MTDPAATSMKDTKPAQSDEVQVRAGTPRALVEVEGLGKSFDISPPLLNRLIERQGGSS